MALDDDGGGAGNARMRLTMRAAWGLLVGVAGCAWAPDRQPQVHVGNLARDPVVQFCIKAADADAFVQIPRPASGAPAYRLGDFSRTLRVQPGPKTVRVVRRGAGCADPSTLVPDFALDLSGGTTTTLVLADDAVGDSTEQALVLRETNEAIASDATRASSR
jgi:hypothetical protein